MTKVFLTGEKGVGKSSLVRAFLRDYPGRIGGFYTQPISVDGQTVGHELKAIEGERKQFATLDTEGRRERGRYCLDVSVFDTLGVSALQQASRDADLIVLDELGRVEWHAERFRKAVEACLAGDTPMLGVVQHQSPFLDVIRAHGISIWEVVPESWESILQKLRQELLS